MIDRMGGVERRIGGLESKVDAVEAAQQAEKARTEQLEVDLRQLREELTELKKRPASSTASTSSTIGDGGQGGDIPVFKRSLVVIRGFAWDSQRDHIESTLLDLLSRYELTDKVRAHRAAGKLSSLGFLQFHSSFDAWGFLKS